MTACYPVFICCEKFGNPWFCAQKSLTNFQLKRRKKYQLYFYWSLSNLFNKVLLKDYIPLKCQCVFYSLKFIFLLLLYYFRVISWNQFRQEKSMARVEHILAYEALGEYGLISFQLWSIFQLPSNYINLFI